MTTPSLTHCRSRLPGTIHRPQPSQRALHHAPFPDGEYIFRVDPRQPSAAVRTVPAVWIDGKQVVTVDFEASDNPTAMEARQRSPCENPGGRALGGGLCAEAVRRFAGEVWRVETDCEASPAGSRAAVLQAPAGRHAGAAEGARRIPQGFHRPPEPAPAHYRREFSRELHRDHGPVRAAKRRLAREPWEDLRLRASRWRPQCRLRTQDRLGVRAPGIPASSQAR